MRHRSRHPHRTRWPVDGVRKQPTWSRAERGSMANYPQARASNPTQAPASLGLPCECPWIGACQHGNPPLGAWALRGLLPGTVPPSRPRPGRVQRSNVAGVRCRYSGGDRRWQWHMACGRNPKAHTYRRVGRWLDCQRRDVRIHRAAVQLSLDLSQHLRFRHCSPSDAMNSCDTDASKSARSASTSGRHR